MRMRRFTKLTDACLRRAEYPSVPVALHFTRCQWVRQLKKLWVTPARVAGGSDRLWTLEEMVEHIALPRIA
jgi:hypothetical protein